MLSADIEIERFEIGLAPSQFIQLFAKGEFDHSGGSRGKPLLECLDSESTDLSSFALQLYSLLIVL